MAFTSTQYEQSARFLRERIGCQPVLGLVLGVMMLARPWFSLLSLEYLVSFYLMLLGVDCIILACSRLGSRR